METLVRMILSFIVWMILSFTWDLVEKNDFNFRSELIAWLAFFIIWEGIQYV